MKRLALVAASFCVAAACASFTAATDAPDASAADANAGDAGAPDAPTPCPPDHTTSFSLDAFKGAGGDGGTLDGGSLSTTATAISSGNAQDYRLYSLTVPTSLDLDYELVIAGVPGAYAESGCDVLFFHSSSAFEPLTRLLYTHESTRNWSFRTQRLPTDAGPPATATLLEALAPTPVKRHVHLHLDISPSRLTGTAAWEGAPDVTIDQPLEPVMRMEIICGVYFASFVDGGSFSVTTSELTGTACRR